MAKTAKSKTKSAKTAAKPATKAATSKPKTKDVAVQAIVEPTKAKAPAARQQNLSQQFVFGRLLAELVGTFVLTGVVLASANGKFAFISWFVEASQKSVLESQGQVVPIFVGTAILAALTIGLMVSIIGKLSGAHINPAITIGMWATRQIKTLPAVLYIVAQVLGAMLAIVIATKLIGTADGATTNTVAQQFNNAGGWGQAIAEGLGALIFGFGVASVALGKKTGIEAAATVGGAFLLGAVIASMHANGFLNPAVALGVGSVKLDFASIMTYMISPIIGAVLGAFFYKLLQSDVEKAGEQA